MEQALLCVELLLPSSPHKRIAALAAHHVLVGQRHRHSRAPPAKSYAGASSAPSARAVRRRPSRSGVFGRQSPSCAALPGSTHPRRTSPGRAGAILMAGGGPRTEVSADTRSFTLVARPVPMLYTPACVPPSAARTASTTSATYT